MHTKSNVHFAFSAAGQAPVAKLGDRAISVALFIAEQ